MGDPIDQYKKLSTADIAVIIFSSAASLGCGVLWVWLFAPALVDVAPTSKILLLAIGASLPPTCLAIAAHAFLLHFTAPDYDGDFIGSLLAGSLVSLTSSSIGLSGGVFFAWPLRVCIGLSLVSWVAGICFFRWGGVWRRETPQHKPPETPNL